MSDITTRSSFYLCCNRMTSVHESVSMTIIVANVHNWPTVKMTLGAHNCHPFKNYIKGDADGKENERDDYVMSSKAIILGFSGLFHHINTLNTKHTNKVVIISGEYLNLSKIAHIFSCMISIILSSIYFMRSTIKHQQVSICSLQTRIKWKHWGTELIQILSVEGKTDYDWELWQCTPNAPSVCTVC